MRLGRLPLVAVALLALTFGRLAGAADPWEADAEDDGAATRAYLHPGQSQHGRDLEGGPATPDQDWVFIMNASRHSYEARATGGPLWAATFGGPGATLERLAADGTTVFQTGTDAGLASQRGHAIRWLGGNAPSAGYLRVTGPSGVAQGTSPYTLELVDTTYAVPRFNNSATQVTFLIIQNNTSTPVSAFVYFFNAAGTLLHTEPTGIQADGVLVLNTSTIGALAGQSGAARVAHTGGQGALSGKAVALEPANGFTFDTAMTPVQP